MFLLWLRQLPRCGDQTPASVPPPAEGRSSPTNTPVHLPVPSSYRVLRGSICSFPLVRYSCPLSAGVLHALLCLKVYSWCIHGERCTPCPPTPPSSCSLHLMFFEKIKGKSHSTTLEVDVSIGLSTKTLGFLFIWLYHTACGIQGPWPGMESEFRAVEAWSLTHWVTREVPNARI